jgi:prefoldin subunit 5
MSEGMTDQMKLTAERLAAAAESLDKVLERLDGQQMALNAKVDRIVAAVEDVAELQCGSTQSTTSAPEREDTQVDEDSGAEGTEDIEAQAELRARVSELEKANADLKAQAARLARKTMSPAVSALLSKSGGEAAERFDAAAIEKTLEPLTVEQRIAVKAEMARAGMID